MNTSELIEKIAADNRLTKAAVKTVVDGVSYDGDTWVAGNGYN